MRFLTGAIPLFTLASCQAFSNTEWTVRLNNRCSSLNMIFGLGGGDTPKIPTSTTDRANRAIASIQRALASPKNRAFPMIECEFPPLGSLNKLGDGSLRSSQEVDRANLEFGQKLIGAISLPLIGSEVCLMISSAAPAGFLQQAKSIAGSKCRSLREGAPTKLSPNAVCVLLAPSTRTDYEIAKSLVQTNRNKVVIVNGFAKDRDSVPGEATMAYYFKPLTYNSQVAGYLIREYPGPWTTIDATSKAVLQKIGDSTILVEGTNTPDLRESGRLVQKSVDTRAIQSRAQR
ncbi:hypothetical protein ACA910_008226 [Epithemia clementina (nom. ined.)]